MIYISTSYYYYYYNYYNHRHKKIIINNNDSEMTHTHTTRRLAANRACHEHGVYGHDCRCVSASSSFTS